MADRQGRTGPEDADPSRPAPAEVEVVAGETDAAAGGGASSRFGSGAGHGRIGLLYGGLLVTIAVVLTVLLDVGSGLQPGGGGGAGAEGGAGGGHGGGAGGGEASIEHVLWRLLLAVIVIIVLARVVGSLLRRIKQPQVVGEIIAGIMLGPSFLGAVSPAAQAFLFPDEILPFLDLLANVGLIFFMFLVGLELDVRLIRGRGHAAVWVSHASIIAPFLSGVALALVIFPILGGEDASFSSFALFIGASMSITAFPVLARILTERGLYKTQLGAVTLTCAAVDDVTAWCLLAIVVTIAQATGLLGAGVTIGLSILFIAAMILVVRPLLQRLATYHEDRGRLSGTILAALFAGIILSALITDRIGIHVIFGAFLFGAVMPHRPAFVQELTEKVEDFSVLFLLPIFFAFSGLRTEIGLLGSEPQLWLITLAILAVAIVGKWGGSALAGRMVGLEWRESSALGVLMNCRGLTELIILNIGLQLGILPPALFAMLVIMAVVTTVMTEPLLSLHYPRDEQRRMVAEEGGEDDPEDRRFRIMVLVGNPRTAPGLVRAAISIAGDRKDVEAQVLLVRVVELPGSAYSTATRFLEPRIAAASEALRPLVALVEEAGLAAVPVVTPSSRVADAVVRVAADRDADLLLLGHHRAVFGGRLLGGVVGEVLRDAATDVAVLVDPRGDGELSLGEGGRILVPFGGGSHEGTGLDLALQLGRTSGAEVVLMGPDSEALTERAAGIYEATGVWTTPVLVEGDPTGALVERATDVDVIVLGMTDGWSEDQGSLGEVRSRIIERVGTPLLLVRRQVPRPPAVLRILRRVRSEEPEWMEVDAGPDDAAAVDPPKVGA